MPAGRPEKYTPELATKILDAVENGMNLIEACKQHDITHHTFRNWYRKYPDLFTLLTRAREERCYTRFEELDRRVKDETRDYYVDDKGIRRSDNTAVQRDKLIVEQTWRELRALLPKIFGETVKQEISGKDGTPLQATLNITIAK